MTNRTTSSNTHSRGRTLPSCMPNTQPAFDDYLDEFETGENDLDESK
jgi:hypothetical protein